MEKLYGSREGNSRGHQEMTRNTSLKKNTHLQKLMDVANEQPDVEDTEQTEVVYATDQNQIEPKKNGRPKGRTSDPNYTQVSALIPLTLHQRVKMALLRKYFGKKGGGNFSTLVEDLLEDWLKDEENDQSKKV